MVMGRRDAEREESELKEREVGKRMKETFERVTERRSGVDVPVKHFYRRQYQNAGGDWRTIYYASRASRFFISWREILS